MFVFLPAAALVAAVPAVAGRSLSELQQRLLAIDEAKHSLNVSSCPGE